MQVRQYAYFGISSSTITPEDITAAVGLQPDRARPMGSRSEGPPPFPRFHLWDLRSECPDTADLNAHFTSIVSRLRGSEDRIRAFLASADGDGQITVVRKFDPGPEDQAIIEPGRLVDGLERLRGQHPLLGFHLDADVLNLAVRLGVEIDFDEYGDEYE